MIEYDWVIMRTIALVVLVFMTVYIMTVCFPDCGLVYFILMAILYSFVGVVSGGAYRYVWALQLTGARELVEGDVRLTPGKTYMLLFSFCTGVITSVIGIGGGEVMGPFLLYLGMVPVCSTATSAGMSAINTLLNIVNLGARDELPHVVFIIPLVIIGAVGGLLGKLFGFWVVSRYHRSSVLIMTLVVGLAIGIVIYSVYLATEDFVLTVSGSKVC